MLSVSPEGTLHVICKDRLWVKDWCTQSLQACLFTCHILAARGAHLDGIVCLQRVCILVGGDEQHLVQVPVQEVQITHLRACALTI